MPHTTRIPLEPVESLRITTLIDNVCDMLLPDQGPAKRAGFGDGDPPQVDTAFLASPTADVPLAEHGFSALVSVTKDRDRRRLPRPGI